MTPLIDATEMYLRTVWELEEEGITPIRARLVERLGLTAPAVSETVTRLEAEGLMRVEPDRTLALTDAGRELAVGVMRKHRLAERLLLDVVGLDWELAHNEACRWEHVISDHVEERIAELLERPATCPHGNPIPERGATAIPADRARLSTLTEAAKEGQVVRVARISEMLQGEVTTMREFSTHGLLPGAVVATDLAEGAVRAAPRDADTGQVLRVAEEVADFVYVEPV